MGIELFGYPVVFVVNALIELVQAIWPRFRARCFYQDLNALRIPGDHEWNAMMFEILLSDYGYL